MSRFVAFIVVVTCCFATGTAIKCYSCDTDSLDHARNVSVGLCVDLSQNSSAIEKVECASGSCSIVKEGNKVHKRSCSERPKQVGCEKRTVNSTDVETCTCNTDLCTGSSERPLAFGLLVGVQALVLAFCYSN